MPTWGIIAAIVGGVWLAFSTVHWNDTICRPFAAKLALPSIESVAPFVAVPVVCNTAKGRCAAATAAAVLSIPAPQVSVVQRHSNACTSLLPAGT